MTDRDHLLRAICAAPEDDIVRLVFADEIEANGEGKYAAFIRAQIAAPDRGRIYEFARPGGAEQFSPGTPLRFCGALWAVPGWSAIGISRGFVTSVAVRKPAFLAVAAELFSAQPITRVKLDGARPSANWSRNIGPRERYSWYNSAGRSGASPDAELPDELMPLSGYARCDYADIPEALDALSERCVRFGRAAAGLPEWTPERAAS